MVDGCTFDAIEDKNHNIRGISGYHDSVLSAMVHQIDADARHLRGGYPDETAILVAGAMAKVLTNQ